MGEGTDTANQDGIRACLLAPPSLCILLDNLAPQMPRGKDANLLSLLNDYNSNDYSTSISLNDLQRLG